MALDLEKLNIIIESNSKNAEKAVDNLTASLQGLKDTLGGLSTSGKNGASGIGKIGTQIQDLGTQSSNAKTKTEQLADSLDKTGEAAGNAGGKIRDTGNETEEAGKKAEKASNGGFKNFFASIKRIAMYRLIRTALKEIIAGFRQGIEMFYEWDKTSNNGGAGFAESIDKLKKSLQELIGALGPMVASIWNVIGPAVTWLIDRLTDIADAIQQIIRALQGETTWYKAVWKEGKKATKQAKELQRVLFGFDELNVLPSKRGSGSMGTLGHIEYEEREIPDWMKKVQGFFHNWKQGVDDTNKSLEQNAKTTDEASEAAKKLNEHLQKMGEFLPGVAHGLEGVRKEGEETKKWFGQNPIPIPVYAEEKSPTPQDVYKDAQQTLKKPVSIPTLVTNPSRLANTAWLLAYSYLTKKITIPTSVQNAYAYAVNTWNSVYSTLNKLITIPTAVENPSAAAEQAHQTVEQTLSDPVNVPVGVNASSLAALPALANQLNQIVQQTPVMIPALIEASGVGQAAYSLWKTLQDYFNKNVISIPVKVGQTTTGKVETGAKSSAAKGANKASQLWAEQQAEIAQTSADVANLAAASAAAAAAAASINPYANMSATDMTNWAESTGLGSLMTDADRQAAAATVGAIVAAPLTGAALSGATAAATSSAGLLELLKLLFVGGMASGGTVPNVGTLFYAGERGAEVVSNLGNRTGVTNVSQMAEAVESGNMGVINALYAAANMVVNTVNGKNLDVYLDGAKVGKSVTQYQNNQTRRTGTPGLIGV